MRELNGEQVKAMLLHVADQVIASKDFLTEVDSQIGDGDHGIGMERGMKNAREKILEMEAVTDIYAPFFEMGRTMLMTMGGASGVIFGTMFSGGAKGKAAQETLDCPRLAGLMKGSLAKIKERGQAQPGDKTMVTLCSPLWRLCWLTLGLISGRCWDRPPPQQRAVWRQPGTTRQSLVGPSLSWGGSWVTRMPAPPPHGSSSAPWRNM